jgi:hypothetical protein
MAKKKQESMSERRRKAGKRLAKRSRKATKHMMKVARRWTAKAERRFATPMRHRHAKG